MTRIDRFLATIDGKAISPPVWTADLSYWISGSNKSLEEYRSEEGYLEFCDRLGSMPYYWYDKFWAADRMFAESPEIIQLSSTEQLTRWRIGTRILERIERYSSFSYSKATTKYPVETVSDLRAMIELIETSALKNSAALDEYPARRERWERYDGLPCIGFPRSPLPAFITEWAGVENGILLLLDEPDLCAHLFAVMAEQETPILEAIASSVPLVHFPDNLTSEVYTSLFDRHMKEAYEHRLEILRRDRPGGDGDVDQVRDRTRCAVHLDGTVNGMLQKLCSLGIDAVEAVTPLPVGDMSVAAMRDAAAASRTVLWGGVPGAMFAQPYDSVAMERHIYEVLEAWSSTPFILGVADQVPPDGDIDLVGAISRIVGDSSASP